VIRDAFGRPFFIMVKYLLILSFMISTSFSQTIMFDEIGVKYYLDQNTSLNDFRENLRQIKEYRISTLFVNPVKGDSAYYNSLLLDISQKINLENEQNNIQENSLDLGLIIPIFLEQNENYKSILAVNKNDERADRTWQKIVCPSNLEYKSQKLKLINESTEKLRPKYLLLDFIRFPIHWEEIDVTKSDYNFEEFCFCTNCINKFKIYLKENSKEFNDLDSFSVLTNKFQTDWYKWRSLLISGFVKNVREIVDPNIQIIINTIPWNAEFADSALYKITGQDLSQLAKYSDFFSPMIYHKKINADNQFIQEIIQDQVEFQNLFPAFQAGKVASEEFKKEDLESVFKLAKRMQIKKIILFDFNRLKENYTPIEFIYIITE